jgi:transcriptional regulator with XRE-family HTH domain
MTNLSDEQIYLIIGRKIKETRTRLGISQTELAKRINMVRTSLTNIESGEQKPPIHVLYKIAGVLKIPITALLPETEEHEIDIAALLNLKKVVDAQGHEMILDDQEKGQILDLIKPRRRQSDDQEG